VLIDYPAWSSARFTEFYMTLYDSFPWDCSLSACGFIFVPRICCQRFPKSFAAEILGEESQRHLQLWSRQGLRSRSLLCSSGWPLYASDLVCTWPVAVRKQNCQTWNSWNIIWLLHNQSVCLLVVAHLAMDPGPEHGAEQVAAGFEPVFSKVLRFHKNKLISLKHIQQKTWNKTRADLIKRILKLGQIHLNI